MQRLSWLIFLLLLALPAAPAGAGTALQVSPTPSSQPDIAILTPQPGAALQGSIQVSIDTDAPGFQSSVIEFMYVGETISGNDSAWFLIDERSQPVNGPAVEWDTSTITDGVYIMRLVVTFSDGRSQSVEIGGLRVRNYTPVETDTLIPATATADLPPVATIVPPTPTGTPSPTWTARPPTSTPLPSNPLEISRSQVTASAALGGLAVIGLFASGAAYGLLKRLGRRR